MEIDRRQAKILLASKQASEMSELERVEIFTEYWNYDSEEELKIDIKEGLFPEVSKSVILGVCSTSSPAFRLGKEYDVLLYDWLIFKLNKVRNEYISSKLANYGLKYQVSGQIEKSGLCPCCTYYSIDTGDEGLWDVCSVCYWENGGDGPNHMSLDKAKRNFSEFGAMSLKHLEHVDPEGTEKYIKS